jgi:hypothetical protein
LDAKTPGREGLEEAHLLAHGRRVNLARAEVKNVVLRPNGAAKIRDYCAQIGRLDKLLTGSNQGQAWS